MPFFSPHLLCLNIDLSINKHNNWVIVLILMANVRFNYILVHFLSSFPYQQHGFSQTKHFRAISIL